MFLALYIYGTKRPITPTKYTATCNFNIPQIYFLTISCRCYYICYGHFSNRSLIRDNVCLDFPIWSLTYFKTVDKILKTRVKSMGMNFPVSDLKTFKNGTNFMVIFVSLLKNVPYLSKCLVTLFNSVVNLFQNGR